PHALPISATTTSVTSARNCSGKVSNTNTVAPFSTALSRYKCPSVCTPRTATKRLSAETFRESKHTDNTSTSRSPSSCCTGIACNNSLSFISFNSAPTLWAYLLLILFQQQAIV